VIHRHQNIAQNGSRPRPDRPHALRRLGPRTDPQGPLTEFAPPSLNNRSGYIRVRSGNVQMGEARLARHSNDIAGQSGALGKVDAPIGTGIDHAVVGAEENPGSGGNAAGAGEQSVDAPMPGKIIEVKVSVGQAVKAGDTLLILEAMKMQNEIAAPADGTVKAVNVSAGQSVKVRDALVILG